MSLKKRALNASVYPGQISACSTASSTALRISSDSGAESGDGPPYSRSMAPSSPSYVLTGSIFHFFLLLSSDLHRLAAIVCNHVEKLAISPLRVWGE